MKSSVPIHRASAILAAICAALGLCPINASAAISSEDLARITEAVPQLSLVKPQRPRRLLIFTRNVGYGGHPSIHHANEAFRLIGKRTGAFETLVFDDPSVFDSKSLRRFDAVFFNNTVGNCFTNADLRRNLMEFVVGGGGLMGVHGTTVAFTHWPGAVEDWPEFGFLIGGRGANHKASDEHVWMKLDDAGNPITAMFTPSGFSYRDEFFRVHEPYSRKRVRVLLSMDTNRTDVSAGPALGNCYRPDGDYAVAWIRNHGRGRVFYCTIAHNPSVFWDPTMLRFYQAAIQFVLGDLKVNCTPSAWLTPATLAQEKLGWRLGVEAYTFHKYTLFDGIEKTANLGVPFMGGLSFQKVSASMPKNFEPGLTDDELAQVRMKLHESGLRLLTYYIHDIPADEAGCRRVFEFGRKMGIETFISEPKLEALPVIEKFCDEYDIRVALHNHDAKASPHYWDPEKIVELCRDRSPRLGIAADVGYWIRSGIDPVRAIERCGNRILTVQLHDLNSRQADAHDVPWGTGAGQTARILEALRKSGAPVTMIGLEYSHNFMTSLPEISQSIEFYNQAVLKLAP